MRNIAIVLLILSSASPAIAADQIDLQARVDACEDALDRGDKVINEQATTIQMLDAQNARLQTSLDYAVNAEAKAEGQAKAWYRDPKVVAPLALLTGIALGAYVAKTASK